MADIPTLVVTDQRHVDAFSVTDFSMDMEFGTDKQPQDFEVSFAGPLLKGGEYVYIDATEYGGVVDSINTLSTSDTATYRGRTWHGILACKIVEPPSGQDYRVLSGDLNACLASIVSSVGLSGLFRRRSQDSGVAVSGYKVPRYVDAYTALTGLCASKGCKLMLEHVADPAGGHVDVWGESSITTGEDQADSDVMALDITDNHRVVNHLVCLGKGELKARTVVHLYADANGRVSQTRTFSGVDEIAEVYDYNNSEREDLIKQGTERLQEAQSQGKVDADAAEAATYGWRVGDKLSAVDMAHDKQVTAPIDGMVVKVDKGVLTVDYSVGNADAGIGAVKGPSATSAGMAALSAAQQAQQALDAASRAVTGTKRYYCRDVDGGPSGEWTDQPIPWTPGLVLWSKDVNTHGDGSTTETAPVRVTGNDGASGEAATYICIDPSAGTTFRRDDTETVLQATVIHGGETATTFAALQAMLPGASLEWTRVERDGGSSAVPSTDSRLSDSGMALTVLPSDVSCKAVFNVTLNVPE